MFSDSFLARVLASLVPGIFSFNSFLKVNFKLKFNFIYFILGMITINFALIGLRIIKVFLFFKINNNHYHILHNKKKKETEQEK